MPESQAPFAFCLSALTSYGAGLSFFKSFPDFDMHQWEKLEQVRLQPPGALAGGEHSHWVTDESPLFTIHLVGGYLNKRLGGEGPAAPTVRRDFLPLLLDNKLHEKKQLYWTAGMYEGRQTLHLLGRAKKGLKEFHTALEKQAKKGEWDGTLHDWAACLETLGHKAIPEPSR